MPTGLQFFAVNILDMAAMQSLQPKLYEKEIKK
jgi:hypothetical protein